MNMMSLSFAVDPWVVVEVGQHVDTKQGSNSMNYNSFNFGCQSVG